MKHLLLLIFFNLLLFSNEYNLTQQEQEYLKNKKVLKTYHNIEWKPYSFVQNNEPTGFIEDLLKLFALKTNLKLESKQLDFDKAVEELKANKLDLMLDVDGYYSEESKSLLIKSKYSLFPFIVSIVSKNQYSSYEQLKDKKVGYYKGMEYLFENYPNIKAIPYTDDILLIKDVLNGKLDAVVDDYITNKNKLNELGIQAKFQNKVISNQEILYGYATTNNENKLLLDIFEKVITQDDVKKLKAKWGFIVDEGQNKLNLTQDEKAYLANTKFNIHLNEWTPFRIYDKEKKQYSGMAIDYFEQIANSLNLKYEFKHYDTFSDRLEVEKNDQFALGIFSSKTDDRKEYANFSKPFASYPIALVTNINEDFILDFSKLNGKKIAVGKNFSAYKFLKQYYPDIDYFFVKDTVEAINLVAQGKIYGAIDLLPIVQYDLNLHSHKSLKVSGISKQNLQICISVTKEQKELLPIINKAIDNLPKDIKQTIENKWLIRNNITVISYAWLWYIVGILALIIILIQYRNNKVLDKKNKLERKLLNSLLQAQNISKLGSWEYNVQTNKHIWSNMIFEIFNRDISLGEADVKEVSKYYGKKSWEKLLNAVNICIQKGEPYELLVEVITSNGEQKWAIARGARISDNPVILAGTLQDVTEKILADKENEIQQALMMKQSRHAQMGEMISMIAHQWRQPLNALGIWQQNLLDILMRDNYEHPKLGMIKTEMEKLILHLDQTIKDFRDFFKQDKESKVFKVRDSIKKTIGLINDKINASNININIDVDENIKVKCYENELSQVFMVIINNAQEQLLKENNYSNRNINFSANQDEYNTTITICDNGGGIPSDIIDKIFDPYFSTKSLNGTGIGLYLVKTIIEKSMHGKVTASNTKTGACFIIEIPNEVQIGGVIFNDAL